MSESNSQEKNWMLEQAISEDALKIASLHAESFQKTYLRPGDEVHNQKVIEEATRFTTKERLQMRAELLEHSLNNPDKHFYQIAMHDEGHPIGLIYGTKLDGIQEIEALYVDEQYHGAGVGRALAEAFIEWSDPTKPIELGVHKENERAKKFYTKLGFEALHDDRHSDHDFIEETTMRRRGDNEPTEYPSNTEGEN